MWCKFPLTTKTDGSIVATRSAEVRPTGSAQPLGVACPRVRTSEGRSQDGLRLPHRCTAARRRARGTSAVPEGTAWHTHRCGMPPELHWGGLTESLPRRPRGRVRAGLRRQGNAVCTVGRERPRPVDWRHGCRDRTGPGVSPDLHARRGRPVRRGRVGDPFGDHRQREGRGRLRAARRRDPEVLVADGDQRRRLEVLPRHRRHAGARAQRPAADRPRGRHDHRLGARAEATSRARTTCRPSATSSRTCSCTRRPPSTARSGSTCGVEPKPQCSACFINSVEDTMESILDAGQDRGHALQVRLGHRHEPLGASARRRSGWPAAARPPGPCPS